MRGFPVLNLIKRLINSVGYALLFIAGFRRAKHLETKAENKALRKANDIRRRLRNDSDFAERMRDRSKR